MPLEDRDDLQERLIQVLSYGSDQLTRLEAYAKYWEEKGGTFLRQEDKICAEAILLSYLASRVPRQDHRLRDAVDLLCDRAEGHIVTGRNEALLRRFPQTAATLGVAFVLLSQLDRSKPQIERLLRQAIAQGFTTLSERSIFRIMDTRWTFGLLDSELVQPAEDLISLSTLGSSPHPIYTMNDDNYALTHAIYYLTDFGRGPVSAALERAADQRVDPFLAWTAIREDLDLLGEFLIAAVALRQPVSPAARFASHLFFHAWDDPIGLVGPDYSSARFAELAGEEAAAYAFLENYHTIFVGGILCAVALTVPSRSRETQRREPADQIDPTLRNRCSDAAKRIGPFAKGAPRYQPSLPQAAELPEWLCSRLLLVLGTSPNPPPRWLETAMHCDLSREELVNVLYDALLVEAARSYNLVQLTEALAIGAHHATMRTATFACALQFLLDQQFDDGFIGVNRLIAAAPDITGAMDAQAAIAELLTQIANFLRG